MPRPEAGVKIIVETNADEIAQKFDALDRRLRRFGLSVKAVQDASRKAAGMAKRDTRLWEAWEKKQDKAKKKKYDLEAFQKWAIAQEKVRHMDALHAKALEENARRDRASRREKELAEKKQSRETLDRQKKQAIYFEQERKRRVNIDRLHAKALEENARRDKAAQREKELAEKRWAKEQEKQAYLFGQERKRQIKTDMLHSKALEENARRDKKIKNEQIRVERKREQILNRIQKGEIAAASDRRTRRLSKEYSSLYRQFKSGAITIDQAQKKMQDLNLTTLRQQKVVGLLSRGWQHFKNIFSRVALAMSAFVILRSVQRGLTGFFRALIRSNTQMEVMGMQLNVLYKFGSRVGRVFEYLKEYAITTPFRIQELIRSTITLRAFGREVEKETRVVGDWAAAINQSAEDTALAYAKIISGSPRTRLLLTTRGITMAEFTREVERTGSRALALANIIDRKFGGMADRMATTMQGLLSNIQDIWFLIAEQLGKPLFESIRADLVRFHHSLRELYKDRERLVDFGEIFNTWYAYLKRVVQMMGRVTSLASSIARFPSIANVQWIGAGIAGALEQMPAPGTVPLGAEATREQLKRIQAAQKEARTLLRTYDQMADVAEKVPLFGGVKGLLKWINVKRQYNKQEHSQALILVAALNEQEKELKQLLDYYTGIIEEAERRNRIEDAGALTIEKATLASKLQSDRAKEIVQEVWDQWKAYSAVDKTSTRIGENLAYMQSLLNLVNKGPMEAFNLVLDKAKNRLKTLTATVESIQDNWKEVLQILSLITSLETQREKERSTERELALRRELLGVDDERQRKAIQLQHVRTRLREIGKETKENAEEVIGLREKEHTLEKGILDLDTKRAERARAVSRSFEELKIQKQMLQTEDQVAKLQLKRHILYLQLKHIAEDLKRLDQSKLEDQEKYNELMGKRLDALENIQGINKQITGQMRGPVGREIQRLKEELSWENVLSGLTSALSNFASTLSDLTIEALWPTRTEELDKQIADLQNELAIEQGIKEELTRVQSLQQRIAELERERARYWGVQLRKAVIEFGKELVRIAVRMAAIAAVEKVLGFLFGDRLQKEKKITEEMRKQWSLQMAMAALTGNWAGMGISTATLGAANKISGAILGAQKGFEGLVKKPTLFLTGERGPERVHIQPLPRPSIQETRPSVTIDVHDCEIYSFEDFIEQIKTADKRILYERVA